MQKAHYFGWQISPVDQLHDDIATAFDKLSNGSHHKTNNRRRLQQDVGQADENAVVFARVEL